MKPYGLPRRWEVEYPACADILEYGRASHFGCPPGRSGEHRAKRRNTKARTRRYFKRVARHAGKLSCIE